MEIQLAGQRAVVTGGTRGIGAAIVRALAGAGATVVSTARSQPAAQPPGVHFVESDISSAAGVSDLAERSLEVLGGVDIVVSNAGGHRHHLRDGPHRRRPSGDGPVHTGRLRS